MEVHGAAYGLLRGSIGEYLDMQGSGFMGRIVSAYVVLTVVFILITSRILLFRDGGNDKHGGKFRRFGVQGVITLLRSG